ncbi:MAG: ABC transporter permease [Rhodobacteraceae bacterium]|nr:ABC transporter permease [Paracoccaceae bacterium]
MTDNASTNAAPRKPVDWVEQATAAALPLAICLLALFFYVNVPVFFSFKNAINISIQVAALMTICIPASMLLMAGKVDLSVGSMLALCGIVAGLSFESLGVPTTVALTLAVGAAAGVVNGTLVSVLGFSPIIVTLGSLTLMRGLAQWLAPNPVFGFPESFVILGYGRWLGVPFLTWIMVAVIVLGVFVMRYLPVGRKIVAIGINERAAFLVGVRVRLIGVALYVATGLATATAALMTIARINSAPSGTLGVGAELTVLTAILLGGVPFTGGKGSVLRVALALWLLGMLQNGLILMNVPTEFSLMITGCVLLFAAGLDVLRRERG